MRTEDLIADLASRATPVRPLPAPGIRALSWTGVALASLGLGLAVFGPRRDLDLLIREPGFLWTAALALSTAVLAVTASLVLAIPAAERSPALRIVTLTIVGLWSATLVAAVVDAGHGLAGVSDWYVCFVRVLAIAFVPATAIVMMQRRAAPLRLAWTGAFALGAAAAIGALAIQFICPVNDAGHALAGHFAPVLALAAAGAVGAARLLTKPRG